MARRPRHTRGTSSNAEATSNIRHHTSASAVSVMSLPRMAVKPHSSTHRCICHWAVRCAEAGIAKVPGLTRFACKVGANLFGVRVGADLFPDLLDSTARVDDE